MKQLILVIALVVPYYAYAAGANDGIYEVSIGGEIVFYVSLHQNGNEVVLINLDIDSLEWEALSGTRTDDFALMSIIIGPGTGSLTVIFENESNATLTLDTCVPDPDTECQFPNNTTFQLTKIF